MTERMPSRQTGERTGSRPSAAEGGGASRASLEAGRSPVYLSAQLLPGNRALLLPSPARSSSRELGLSVGRPGPRAFASAPTMLVRHHPRVHRIPASRVVTVAIRPLHRSGMATDNHIFPKNGSRIFSRRGLDSRIGVESPPEIRFLAHSGGRFSGVSTSCP